jgi:hypothetical protein
MSNVETDIAKRNMSWMLELNDLGLLQLYLTMSYMDFYTFTNSKIFELVYK